MQDPWSLTTMVLMAVLVGAGLPVLFQLFLTLGATRRLLDRVGPKLEGTLDELHETSRRLNHATAGIEDSAQRARAFLDATGELGRSINRVNESLRPAFVLGSALGPALAIAIKTLVERYARSECREPDDGGKTGEGHRGGNEPAATEDEPSEQGGDR